MSSAPRLGIPERSTLRDRASTTPKTACYKWHHHSEKGEKKASEVASLAVRSEGGGCCCTIWGPLTAGRKEGRQAGKQAKAGGPSEHAATCLWARLLGLSPPRHALGHVELCSPAHSGQGGWRDTRHGTARTGAAPRAPDSFRSDLDPCPSRPPTGPTGALSGLSPGSSYLPFHSHESAGASRGSGETGTGRAPPVGHRLHRFPQHRSPRPHGGRWGRETLVAGSPVPGTSLWSALQGAAPQDLAPLRAGPELFSPPRPLLAPPLSPPRPLPAPGINPLGAQPPESSSQAEESTAHFSLGENTTVSPTKQQTSQGHGRIQVPVYPLGDVRPRKKKVTQLTKASS